MKLTSLHIEDFRQFKSFRLDFTDPATGQPLEKVCLIGPNGTGKSTLLREILSGFYNGKMVGLPVYHSGAKPSTTWDSNINPEEGLVIHCPPDPGMGEYTVLDFSRVTLGQALKSRESGPPCEQHNFHSISLNSAADFWSHLTRLVAERLKRQHSFQQERKHKTVAELDAEFAQLDPPVIDDLVRVWNRILDSTDLEFDFDSIEIPFHTTESLHAYLRSKTRSERVPYHLLSTGILHYLFRLGHIWSLYFNRPPGDSLLLVDEPEGSLYPDFLYDIVENYREVAPGCQLFMATHSPIVAAQFKPEERFILNFGEDGYVTARRGTSPEGDDPNDLLVKDFGVASLMTQVGERAWHRFLALRRQIPKTPEPERRALIVEYTRLGQAYDFSPPGGTNGDDE